SKLRYDWITTLGFGIFLTSLGVILCYLYGWDIGETDGCLDLMVANSSQPTNSSLDGGLELPREQSDVTENLKLLFFACGAAGFVAMASTVLAFPAEVRVFLNEHRNRWYSTSSYYWSKSLIEIPVTVIWPPLYSHFRPKCAKSLIEIPVTVTLSVLYSTIIFYASGQESDEFFRYGYFVMVNAGGLLVGNGIGHVFGIVFAHNYQLAIITSVAFYLTVFLLGGFPIRLYTQDGFIRAISYISCVKFNFYSNVITLYAFDRCDSTQISLALKQFDLKHDEMWDNCAWILGQLVFFRIFDNYGYSNNELAIAWTNLGFVQKSLFGKRVKTILDSLNGQINFHTLTALMGPSGAGKTTLLKCVNMRSNSGLTADTQMFVNKYTDLRTCFIMQSSDEHILKGLTVRVTVGHIYRDNFAQTGDSLLCFDASDETDFNRKFSLCDDFEPLDINGNFDHNLNVRRILSELLLEDCADTCVQTCSGGEQKRLTVGLELVQQNKPNLMCIDEPTSGLDSNAAELVYYRLVPIIHSKLKL
ncbi:unnamed protein product, partial [Medioppia subpectinata]